jgi:hypothetical protein
MKKLLYPLICLAVLCTNIGRADDLPFFSSLRNEVANQQTVVSNTPPLDKKLAAALRTNLKLIDRTKPTLVNGTTALGALAKNLGRTSLSNTFLPIVTDARSVYADAMDLETDALDNRLADTIPGKARAAAQAALDKLRAAIDDARTNANFTLALRSLSVAAKAVGTAQKAVAKAESAPPGPGFLSATITESNQGVTTFLPTRFDLSDAATYDPFFGELDIIVADRKSLGSGRAQGRLLSIYAYLPGEGAYTLSLTNTEESFAIYERVIASGSELEVEFYEKYQTVDPLNNPLGTGTLTITLDLDARIVWGEFTFTATGVNDTNLTVSASGTFLLRLEVVADE